MQDSEVNDQIAQMVSFIKQEAKEKAREINVKAEEEFHIEKLRMVEAEKTKIRAEYEKKEKDVEVQKRIAHSNKVRDSRLTVLKYRDDALKTIITDSKAELASFVNSGEYDSLLKNILVEALCKLAESESVVYCTAADKSKVDACLGEATELYAAFLAESGSDISNPSVTVCDEPLDDEEVGGVKVSGLGGKISINNTLSARLDLAFEQTLPGIRTTLFGGQLRSS